MDKSLWVLRATNFILILQHKIRHPTHSPNLRLHDFPVDLRAPSITRQPFPNLRLLQARINTGLPQRLMTRNILLFFKITRKELVHHPRLRLRVLLLPQLHQSMRIPRVPRHSAKLEVDSDVFAHSAQSLENHRSFGVPEFGLVVRALIDAGFGRIGVEVERGPGCGEGVGGRGVGGLVGRDAFF